MIDMNPKIIKILPYRGRNNEIANGRKTIIKLYDDRIEYSVKYEESVTLSYSDDESGERKEAISCHEEDGVIDKSGITGFVKYIVTAYTEELEAYNINHVDICSTCNNLTFSVETEEDKVKLYKELYDWKYGK